MEIFVVILMVLLGLGRNAGALNNITYKTISKINTNGPYLGIVVPNGYELEPLLRSASFVPHRKFPYFDIGGKHFRIGKLDKKKVIVVMSGLGMLNGGATTQLLITLFDVEGILHYGIAGNLNPNFQIGDVVIPKYWANTGLWLWQRFEDKGEFKPEFGHLKFSDYNNSTKLSENFLNKISYEAEKIFEVDGIPEAWKYAFWVRVDKSYYETAKKLNNIELNSCVNKTCLPRKPIIKRVKKGISSNVFVNNGAFRENLRSNFDATPTDMESAAVALICHQQKIPFIVIRSLSDLAGGGSALTNEASTFGVLAANNAFDVLLNFIALL